MNREYSCDSSSNMSLFTEEDNNICKIAQKKYELIAFLNYISEDNLFWTAATDPLDMIPEGVIGPYTIFSSIPNIDLNAYYPPFDDAAAQGGSSRETPVNFYQIDPCVDLCALTIDGDPAQLFRMLKTPNRNIPKLKHHEFLPDYRVLDVIETVIQKINRLCISEAVKIRIVDQITAYIQTTQVTIGSFCSSAGTTAAASSTGQAGVVMMLDTGSTGDTAAPTQSILEAGLLAKKQFCCRDSLPNCGQVYIKNWVNIGCPGSVTTTAAVGVIRTGDVMVNVLSFIRYLFSLYFIPSSDNRSCSDSCELTYERACKEVFGKYCIIDVPIPPCEGPGFTIPTSRK